MRKDYPVGGLCSVFAHEASDDGRAGLGKQEENTNYLRKENKSYANDISLVWRGK